MLLVILETTIALILAGGEIIGYLALYRHWSDTWEKRVNSLGDKFNQLRNLGPVVNVSERLWSEIARRENSMILMGSLVIPTAFGLLIVAALPPSILSTPEQTQTARTVLTSAAVFLYSWWLFTVQLPVRVMNDISYQMQRMTEDSNGIGHILEKLYGRDHGSGSLMKVRRNHWLAYLVMLLFAATFILGGVYG